jgi:DNA mismatch endonuclease (patch repair protein)
MDRFTRKARSAIMRGSKSKNTRPELRVRKLAHRLGYRYRLHVRSLPGCPDLVFPSRYKVIFVHGCFWHQHDDQSCRNGQKPKSNEEYWHPKLQRNVERDREQIAQLNEMGWEVLVIWECETTDEKKISEELKHFLGPPRTTKKSVQGPLFQTPDYDRLTVRR